MRKKDPRGNYRVHPEDPRIMIRIKPGETGEYILLGREGIDNDGDGRINEDGPGGYDMNRNYGYGWQPSYVQRGAGYYPFCWPETRAIRDFLLAHPNIVGAQNFHNTGGMILKGPGAKSIGAYPPTDQRVYDYIGKLGEKLLPKYRYLTIYSGLYSVYGGSIDYLYSILGIFTFSNELDMSPFDGPSRGESGEPESEEMREFRSLMRQKDEMLYHDRVLLGEHYADWKPYHHPLYGDIEIGGVKKFGRRVSTLFNLPSTCHRNAAFCLFHADQLPRLAFDEVKVEAVGNGTFRIDVTMANSRVTPSISAEALQNALYRADRLKVTGKGIRLVAAGKLIDRFRGITEPVKTQDNFVWIKKGIPGFSKVDFSLLVKGQGKMTLDYDSLKGGYKEYMVDVK